MCLIGGCETDQKRNIVRLNRCILRGAIAPQCPAPLTAVQDDKSPFGVRLDAYGPHQPAAGRGPVTRMLVYMQRIQTAGAMIAGRVAERFDFETAMLTDEAVVVFPEMFGFQHGPILLSYFRRSTAY